MNDNTELRGWTGRTLVDASGEKVGTIDNIYEDVETGQPEWIAVNTGLFGSKSSFVPVQGARTNGEDLQVDFTMDQIKDSPNVDADGELTEEEEERLYSHYGVPYTNAGTTEATGMASGTAAGGSADDAMTRSEEELEVGTVRREAGRVRLRKWVETEQVQASVPVTHEEVRIEREPITDANLDPALSGPEITESEHEVVLHEDEVVANTHVEPKERVRLSTDEVVEQETVDAELRKERIEVEEEPTTRR